MLALPSSLVGQLPFSSSSVGSQSGLGAFIPRTRTRGSLFAQLLRCIRSVDSSQFAFGCCKHRGSCFSASPPGASPRNWKATLKEAGLSEFGVCFTSGGYTGRFLSPGKGDHRRPESWRFHDSSVRGGSEIYGDCFPVKSCPLFRTTEKMTSVASRGSSRQLRERKETHISLSTQAIGRKKTKGLVARETTSADDEMEPHQGPDESAGAATEFEARLWDLDRSNKLTTLTVLELRGYMKLMSKPTAGRKDELISTVKEWLASRGSFTAAKMKQAEATQETSSDAESLEGALLKAENKNREAEAEAMSRRTDLTAKRVNQKRQDAAVADATFVQQDMLESTAPKLKSGDAPTRGKLSKNEELDGSLDEEIAVNVTTKRKRLGKLSKNEEVDGSLDEEIAVKATTKRKTAVKSNDVGSVVLKEEQGKKRKLEQVTTDAQEETSLQIAEEKAVEIIVELKKPWLMLAHKKPKADWVVYDPETMRPAALPSSVKAMKLLSWNVNGLRALMKEKDKKAEECLLLTQLANEENFDVLCLQETKLQEKDVEQLSTVLLPEYADCFWSCSTAKLGYSGTAIISRVKPLSVKYGLGIPDHDNEGRVITAEFEHFYLVTAYVPNSGDKLVRLPYRTEEWDPTLSQYLKELENMKPVVYTGDLNCANEEIDISNPDGNRKTAGFTNEERESFKTNFLNKGFVDTFRQQHPNVVGYTYWGYRSGARAKNTGWRLDYFLVSEGLMDQIHDSYIRPDVLGSDHCPIGLIVKV